MNCRINLQRTWASRIQLEAQWHPYSTFVTLTYSDDHCPVTEDGLGNLSPEDLTSFLRRFRKGNGSFRYFACGEYGEMSQRPHYHLIMFGISIHYQDQVAKAWRDPKTKEPLGFISLAELTPARSAYVAQYTCKKMTKRGDERLLGRYPEFARMSTKPGIGNCVIPWLADQHRTRLGSQELLKQGDVFTAIRIDGKIWPLGNYLRSKLRENLGVGATRAERADQFNKPYYPSPQEWAQPLPEDYCPEMDVLEVNTMRKFLDEEKDWKEKLPEIRQKADRKTRAANRRKSGNPKI